MMNAKFILLAVIVSVIAIYLGLTDTPPAPVGASGAASAQIASPQVAAVGAAFVPVAAPMVPSPGDLQPFTAPFQPPAALGPTAPNTSDAVAANYIPRTVKVFEGHWQGLDSRLMTVELARKLQFPLGLRGVLIGEVTLNAVTAGLMAGDVITKLEDFPIATMEEFQEASRMVMNRNEARLTVIRKAGTTFHTLTLTLRAERGLGFVQVEGAPMIQPGDPRPHPYRGPCTDCHTVGSGFELAPDPDLISLPPPVISRKTANDGIFPHEDRGPCEACHVIK
jgi:membrane-associated protease RseP (regulator of RpoE activity)